MVNKIYDVIGKCLLSFVIVVPVCCGATSYNITKLSDIDLIATSINDAGVVAAYQICQDPPQSKVYTWQNGVLTQLNRIGTCGNVTYGINNAGVVVGTSDNTSSERAVMWNGTNVIDLGLPTRSFATSINNSGQITIVRWYDDGNGGDRRYGVIYSNGNYTYLNHPGDEIDYVPYAINDNGVVAGQLGPDYESSAFIWENGVTTDIGKLGGWSGWAESINNANSVVGCFYTSTTSAHAFCWSSGQIIDLGTLGGDFSVAHSINDLEQVVGVSTVSPYDDTHAFLYEDGKMIDLNSFLGSDTEWEYLSEAYDINNKGQIVGMGYLKDGSYVSFLMTPVPEPGMMVLLGLAALMMRRRFTN